MVLKRGGGGGFCHTVKGRSAVSTRVFISDSHTWRLVLLACSGQKAGMLPSVLERTGQPLSHRIIRTKCPQCWRWEALSNPGGSQVWGCDSAPWRAGYARGDPWAPLPELLMRLVWSRAQTPAILTSSQVMLMLPVYFFYYVLPQFCPEQKTLVLK